MWSGEVETSFDSTSVAVVSVSHIAPSGPCETGAGHSAEQIRPGGAITSIGRKIPSVHGRSCASSGSTPA